MATSLGALALALALDLPSGVARAAEPSASASSAHGAWQARYEEARTDLLDGRARAAEEKFAALVRDAETESDRTLAKEMHRIAEAYAARVSAAFGAGDQAAVSPAAPSAPVRTKDEITLLYTTAFLYGAGTGTWFLLQVEPDSAITATIPFAALTAAPVVALTLVDGARKLPRGLAHAMASGVYLGLGQGIWVTGYHQSRAARVERTFPGSDVRWDADTTATVLWGGATLGAVLGGAVGAAVPSTPGRVSLVASTTLWAGALSGLGVAALHPDDPYRAERAFVAGGAGYNAGLAAGLLAARHVAPSVTRVRLVDLAGLAGGFVTSGIYLSLAGEPDKRLTEGVAVLGAGAGLALGWILTAAMPGETASAGAPRATSHFTVQPTLQPLPGGAALGVGGTL